MSLKFLHFSYVTNDKMKLATLKDRHFFYLQSHEIIGGTRTVEALSLFSSLNDLNDDELAL